MSFKTESLAPHTFNGWTDSVKVVVDMYCTTGAFSPEQLEQVDIYMLWANDLELVQPIFKAYPLGTFYMIGPNESIQEMVRKYPWYDIRQLIV